MAKQKKNKNKRNFNEWEDYQDIRGKGTRRNKRRKERIIGKHNLKGMVDGNIDHEDYMDNLER